MKREKTGGRAKGVPNKTTKQLKTMVHNFIADNWETVIKDFNSPRLHPRDRLNFIERILKYCIPIIGSSNSKLEIKRKLESLSDADLHLLAAKVLESNNDNDFEE